MEGKMELKSIPLKNKWSYEVLYRIKFISNWYNNIRVAVIDNELWYVSIISLSDKKINYGFEKIEKVHYTEVDEYKKIFREAGKKRVERG